MTLFNYGTGLLPAITTKARHIIAKVIWRWLTRVVIIFLIG